MRRGNKRLRAIDRYLGGALILFFALFKYRRKRAPENPERIGLLKSSGIGDMVLLSAIVSDLRSAYPKAEIILFTTEANSGMSDLIEHTQAVSLDLSRPIQAIKQLRSSKLSILLEFDVWPKISGLLLFFSKAAFTAGHRIEKSFRHLLLDRWAPHLHSCHELENFRKLIVLIGIVPKALPQIRVESAAMQNRIVLHTQAWGAKADLRLWPMEKWQALIRLLLERDFDICLTGSSREREKIEEICAPFEKPKVKSLAGKLSIKETAEWLAASRALVSVDTGIMHLGAAVGAPVVALHGPSRPERWGAIGNVRVVRPNLDYTPCLSRGYEGRCTRNLCMQAIETEAVLEALDDIIKGDRR